MSVSEGIYSSSPLWLQNIMVSAKGLQFRFSRASTRIIRDQWTFLLNSQYWTREEHSNYQVKCLRKILRTAFESVPYYRNIKAEINCEYEDFRRVDDIRSLPFLEKDVVRNNSRDLLNISIRDDLYKNFTSGTTGTPMEVFETQESFSRRWAFVARLRTWAGIECPIYPKRAQFTGRNIIPIRQEKSGVYWRHNYAGNALLLSTVHLSPNTVPRYIRAIKKYRPDLIDGYPSAMLILARVGIDLGMELPRPKAIIVTAETLLPAHREELEKAFCCKVFNQYAATEPSCFWCDCEFGNMHINPEYGISEILNKEGKEVLPGEAGEIVVTSFLNNVMPLIRYRIGDIGVLKNGSDCRCGRKMPCIEKIDGRMDDILYIPARGYVGRLDPSFKALSNIIESQVIQESFNDIRILIVPDAGYKEDIGRMLIENLRYKLGAYVRINIEIVDRIPRGSNGKFISVISHVKHLYPRCM